MSQAKHTSGPWKVRNAREVFKGGRRICFVNAGESLCLREEMERAAQNARLIAAAPELLDALIVCCDLIEGEGFEPPGNARAAIAKATGGE